MTRKLARHPLIQTVFVANLLVGCARSAIEETDEEDAFSVVEEDASGDEEDAAEPVVEEDAAGPAVPDAQPPVIFDAGPGSDAGAPPDAAAPADSGQPMLDASKPPEAGMPEASTPEASVPDAAPPRDAAPPADSATDASKPDAAPDAAPPAPKCTAGNYKGDFMGAVSVVLFDIPLYDLAITGTITLAAAADPANPDRFLLQNGAINGTDPDGNKVMATVTGSVNCTTGKVENGKLQGSYFRPPLINEITFTGAVVGTYTNTPPSAVGTWTTDQGSSPFLSDGSGTWNMAKAP